MHWNDAPVLSDLYSDRFEYQDLQSEISIYVARI